LPITVRLVKMRLPTRNARLLLLIAPAVATALSPDTAAVVADVANVNSNNPRSDPASQVAPFDGNDGRPHNGPWIETDGVVDAELPPLEGRPDDPTVVDGKKIPESHDGVMNDPNRAPPKDGTRGTEGGVSEKTRKAKEGEAGGGAERTPETPKEAPLHSHEEEVANSEADAEADASYNLDGKAAGIEVGCTSAFPGWIMDIC
jgi:hypothetical protein